MPLLTCRVKYFLVIFLLLICGNSYAKNDDTTKGQAVITFNAQLIKDSSNLTDNVHWFLFSKDNNNLRLLTHEKGGSQSIALYEGNYTMVTTYGYAKKITHFDVVPNSNEIKNIVLQAGILSLNAHFPLKQATENARKNNDFTFSLTKLSENDEDDDEDNIEIGVILSKQPITLTAGSYEINTYFRGQLAAKNDLKIIEGRHVQADILLDSAQIKVHLANREGGEALIGPIWSIFAETSDLAYEKASSYIEPILASGKYTIIATYKGEVYQKVITVKPGEHQHIELLTSKDKEKIQ